MPQPNSTPSQAVGTPADNTERDRRDNRSDEYTLKIIVSGIVPLVPEYDEGGTPKRFWALVSNLTDPSKLPKLNGYDLSRVPPHSNRLLFSHEHLVDAGDRTVEALDGQVGGDSLNFVSLANEDWRLEAASSQRPLEIIQGEIVPPVPCDPGMSGCPTERPQHEQETDFGWTIDLDAVAQELVQRDSSVPSLQKGLFSTPCQTTGDFPLLSARFAFDAGTISAAKLDRDGPDGPFLVSQFNRYDNQKNPIFRRTVATSVQLTLPVTGEVKLVARSLYGEDQPMKPIRLKGRRGSEVVLYIENQPKAGGHGTHHHGENHFLVNYCLYERLQDFDDFLGPIRHPDGPALNAQCSPARFTFPIGA